MNVQNMTSTRGRFQQYLVKNTVITWDITIIFNTFGLNIKA